MFNLFHIVACWYVHGMCTVQSQKWCLSLLTQKLTVYVVLCWSVTCAAYLVVIGIEIHVLESMLYSLTLTVQTCIVPWKNIYELFFFPYQSWLPPVKWLWKFFLSCLSFSLSDDNFRKPWRTKCLVTHPADFLGIRVKLLFEGYQVMVTVTLAKNVKCFSTTHMLKC